MNKESSALTHVDLEPAKWLAVIAMTLDHFGKITLPDVYLVTNSIGRLSLPLFAWIIGTRLLLAPRLSGYYIRHLGAWMVISQPFFVYSGNSWWHPNIFFTLFLGTVLFHGLTLIKKHQTLLGTALISLSLLFSISADYHFGVFIIPAFALIPYKKPLYDALWLGVLGVLSNFSIPTLTFGPGSAYALFTGLVVWLTYVLPVKLPRIPKIFFYAYYPLHLMLLRWIAPIFQ